MTLKSIHCILLENTSSRRLRNIMTTMTQTFWCLNKSGGGEINMKLYKFGVVLKKIKTICVPRFLRINDKETTEKNYVLLFSIDHARDSYWEAGKNSRIRMEVQGSLMQARSIEIHQVFAKNKGQILF